MTQFFALGAQIVFVVLVGLHADRYLLDDLEPVPLESNHFFRVIGEESNFFDTKIGLKSY